MLKRFISGILCVICIALCGYCASFRKDVPGSILSSTRVDQKRVIIIDAGHGGFDGGAVASDGTIEKDLNLEISLKVDALLRAAGYNTVLVRSTDTAINDSSDVGKAAKAGDIKNRVALMKKYPDSILVSIHMNKYSTTQPHGAQVFYSNAGGSSVLAECIQQSVAAHVQTDNRRVIKKTTKDIYLLYNATVPAVIVECGFLSNPDDLSNLKNKDYQLKIALAMLYGIMDYHNQN